MLHAWLGCVCDCDQHPMLSCILRQVLMTHLLLHVEGDEHDAQAEDMSIRLWKKGEFKLWLGALADLLTISRHIPRITLAPTCSHQTGLQSGRVFLRSQCESLGRDILQERTMRWKSFCPIC